MGDPLRRTEGRRNRRLAAGPVQHHAGQMHRLQGRHSPSIRPAKPTPFPYVWSAEGKFLGRWPTNYAVVPEADHLTGDKQPSPDFTHFVFSSLDVPFKPGGLEVAPGLRLRQRRRSGHDRNRLETENGDPIPQDAGGVEEYIRFPASLGRRLPHPDVDGGKRRQGQSLHAGQRRHHLRHHQGQRRAAARDELPTARRSPSSPRTR